MHGSVIESHLDLSKGIESPQREEEQGRELPGDHSECSERRTGEGKRAGWLVEDVERRLERGINALTRPARKLQPCGVS